MKRELIQLGYSVNACCAGHDIYPCDTFNNRRSKRARARDKKAEHQHARTLAKRALKMEIEGNSSHE